MLLILAATALTVLYPVLTASPTGDRYHHDQQQQQQQQQQQPQQLHGNGLMYFAIAAPPGEPNYSRTFNKTVASFAQTLFIRNVTVSTLVIDLPANGSFSAALLEKLCGQFEGKHVVAILIVGDSTAAFTVSLAATYVGIPVLWARGQDSVFSFGGMEKNPLEIHIEPATIELIQAMRSLLIHTHWHTFTLLTDHISTTALQQPHIWKLLDTVPLHPTLISLPPIPKPHLVFRKLAEISRSTRGVVILFCDLSTAIKILEEARKLNMIGGHFIWIWIDTSYKTNYNANVEMDNITPNDETTSNSSPHESFADAETRSRKARETPPPSEVVRNDLMEMHLSYLLQNDQFIHFNNKIETLEAQKNYAVNRRDKRISDFLNRNDMFINTGKHKRKKGIQSSVHKVSFSDNSATLHQEIRKPVSALPVGLLSLRAQPLKVDKNLVKGTVKLVLSTLKLTLNKWTTKVSLPTHTDSSCWRRMNRVNNMDLASVFARELAIACAEALAGRTPSGDPEIENVDKSMVSNFEILNLVPEITPKDTHKSNRTIKEKQDNETVNTMRWKRVGMVSGKSIRLDTIVWPGGDLSISAVSSQTRSVFRIVTALASPFVMESDPDEDGQCLRGLRCLRVLTSDKDNLTLVFNEMDYRNKMNEDQENNPNSDAYQQYLENEAESISLHKFKYKAHCCYGFSMDLLENVAEELEFDFKLYVVADGLFGTKEVTTAKNVQQKVRISRDLNAFLNYKLNRDNNFENMDYSYGRTRDRDKNIKYKWNGIVADLISGTAHMSFAPLSVSSSRADVIDFSVPYFYSGVSFLAAPQHKSEIPLMAFLLPFSPELWIAIFTSLNITAIAVAIYEWLSPFGLNPWGRQRSKNFSMSSALWVMWGLLCGHLVAFKAPKSWPNKFLINVWGGFSVIFVASYTANIAALIAGLFFQNTVSNYHDRSLLSQKVGAPRASAAEDYVQKANRLLWEHMHKYTLDSVADGIERLKNGTLDILIADTPILDYYRATDQRCKLQKIGDTINEDTYAIGMAKGFPLKDSISAIIAKYSSNGYMDILQEKWYGGLPCFKYVTEIAQPRPLGVAAVTGVFILLGLGMIVGCLILILEHIFFRYSLPMLREKPKDSIWRSRNIMFFSQKLYRFINCVELVSPHHSARELVHTIRQGQITSLFQKSIKRKEHEQRRRRKSKAQFFEMIQEIRRQQQEERIQPMDALAEEAEDHVNAAQQNDKKTTLSPSIIPRPFKRTSPKPDFLSKAISLTSPRPDDRANSSNDLNERRFSTDSVLNPTHSLRVDHRDAVGRRLSKDASLLSGSPPDINSRRSSYLDIINSSSKLSGKSPVLSIENVSTVGVVPEYAHLGSENIGRKLATIPKYHDVYEQNRLHVNSNTLSDKDKLSAPVKPSESDDKDILRSVSAENLEQKRKFNEVRDELNRATKEKLQSRILLGRLKFVEGSKSTTENTQISIKIEDTSINNKPNATIESKLLHHKLLDSTSKRNNSSPSQINSENTSLKCSFDETIATTTAPNGGGNSPPLRTSYNKSALDRLTREELVSLLQISESELRIQLLHAMQDKKVN